jgi:hypothetical protein
MLLVAYNWPTQTDRYRRVAAFVDAFFSKIEKFKEPGRHPKWKEINLAADVPGWTRFKAAQEWLDRSKVSEKNATSEMRQAFDQFLKRQKVVSVDSNQQREELFAKFIQWWRAEASAR